MDDKPSKQCILVDMDVKIINPFLSATINLLEHTFGLTATTGTPFLLEDLVRHRWEVTGLIAITDDPFTRAAVERTRRVLAFADLVLLVLHAARKSADQLQLAAELGVHRGKLLIVLNKTDITIAEELSGRVAELKHHADHWETEIFPISAAKGTGLPALTAAVFDRLGGLPVSAAAGRIALDLRGRQCLDAVRDALDQARIDVQTLRTRGTAGHLGLETVAADIQTALRALGPLLGKDVTEDVFENIFANFCIGK